MRAVMMLSREVRRVPLDFDAPIGDTWAGYLRPDSLDLPTCGSCNGDGLTPEARQIEETFYAFGASKSCAWNDKITQEEVDHLIEKGRLGTWIPGENGERGAYEPLPRTAEEVNEEQRGGGMGHDGINRMILVRFRCERLGITINCPTCGGEGDVATEKEREAHDNWRPPEPPVGEGWQLWQTVSEGGPDSPVFETAEKLALWLEENYDHFGNHRSYAEWMGVINGTVFGTDIGTGDLV